MCLRSKIRKICRQWTLAEAAASAGGRKEEGKRVQKDSRGFCLGSIEQVPHKRITDMRTMNANLVHAASVGPRLDQRKMLALCQNPNLRKRALSGPIHLLQGRGAMFFSVRGIYPQQWSLDALFGEIRPALDKGQISFFHPPPAKCIDQCLLAVGGLCKHHTSRSAAVKSMNGPHAFAKMRLHLFEQYRCGDATGGHDQCTRHLVDHNMMCAFI